MAKNNITIVLKNNSLEFNPLGLSLPIPETIFDKMEIKNPEELETLITNFIKEKSIKPQKTKLLISDSLFFNKEVASEEDEKVFFDQVPLGEDLKDSQVISLNEKKQMFVINKNLVKTIVDIFDNNGWKITSASPDNNEYSEKVFFYEKETSNKKGIIVMIIVLAIFVVMGSLGYWVINNLKTNNKMAPSEEEIITPTPTPVAYLEKDSIRIQVLNTTKTAGLAGKLKDILIEKGYLQTQTGNSEDEEVLSVSEIHFSDQINEEVKAELVTEIKNDYPDIVQKVLDSKENSDILILIGKS